MKTNKLGYLFSLGVLFTNNKAVEGHQHLPDYLQFNAETSTDSLLSLIQKYVITNENFYRGTLYSWTTQEQVDLIKSGKKVLIKGRGSNEVSFYEKALKSKKFKGHPLAKILREDQFYKKRFSWTNSWATCNGEKNYGNTLLKIKLKNDALICRLNPFYPEETQVMDKSGAIIPNEKLGEVKHRIAAVYYINDTYQKKRRKRVHPTFVTINQNFLTHLKESFFREYVIVNENMIESVDYSSDQIINDLEKELAFLKLLLIELNDSNKETADFHFRYDWYTRSIWASNNLYKDHLPSLYNYSIAFPNDNYKLNSVTIQELIGKLSKKLTLLKNAQ